MKTAKDIPVQLAETQARVRLLRSLILDAIGETEAFPPSIVVGACLDVAAFAAVGVGIDRKNFVETATTVYKNTKVPIEACQAMRAHEERCAESRVPQPQPERRRCKTCDWIGPMTDAVRTDSPALSCPKCHGWALEDPDHPDPDRYGN